eukprot:108164_1
MNKIVHRRTKFESKGDFPTSSVQPNPFPFPTDNEKADKIICGYIRLIVNITIDINTITNTIKHFYSNEQILIYSTRYEIENPDITGIISYNFQTGEHSPIELWYNSTYFPRWNTLIFNKSKDEIIFVGGANVNKNNKEYTLIAFYDIKTHNITTTDINYVIGSNSKAVLVDENKLHIVGGQLNSKHILFDLETKRASFIYDFMDTNPGIQEHGLIYDPIRNTLMMFGGYYLTKYKYYDDFWILNLNEYVSLLPMEKLTSNLVYGYVKNTLMHVMICPFGYDIAINDIIEMYLVNDENKIEYSQWEKVNKYKMPVKLHGFGSVLYDDRVIIMFGGKIEGNHQRDNIYYLDLNSNNGWKECMLKVPKPGSCNAVLINHKIIHILPYSSYTNHWSIHVKDLLPATLV